MPELSGHPGFSKRWDSYSKSMFPSIQEGFVQARGEAQGLELEQSRVGAR